MANIIRQKQPVQLRTKKLASGAQSLYLDIYKDGVRVYEFLKLYLLPGRTADIKAQNENTLRLAKEKQTQKIKELETNRLVFNKRADESADVYGFILEYRDRKQKTLRHVRHITHLAAILRRYEQQCRDGKPLTLSDINVTFARDFIAFLQSAGPSRYGSKYSTCTIKVNYQIMVSIMNSFVRQGKIKVNPFSLLEKDELPKKSQHEVCYLTIDELKTLEQTPCTSETTKRMFMFSAYTGLRLSDVRSLEWKDIHCNQGKYYITKKIVKPGRVETVPLNNKALAIIGTEGSGLVFKQDLSPTRMAVVVTEWGRAAGLTKHVTFHVARHTFATTALTLGADLYTVSRLLCHRDIAATQIYAKVVDQKAAAAADLFDHI